MNVLDFIATADPMLSKKPITMEMRDLDLVTPRENSLIEYPTAKKQDRRRLVLVAAAVVLIASFGVFLPRDSGPTSYDWSAPVISPAAATVNLSNQYAQETRLNPGQTLWVLHENVQFDADGSVRQFSFAKSWLATDWASVSLFKALVIDGVEVPAGEAVWTETSRMSGSDPEDLNDYSIGYSPMWERTVPYDNPQSMYRTLVEQSQTFNASWQSGSEWIVGALQSLIVSETAAPAQRVIAISISNALFEQGVAQDQWVETFAGNKNLWIQTRNSTAKVEMTVVDPQVPGIASAITYRIDGSGNRSVSHRFQLVSWAIVGGLDVEPTASDVQRVQTPDVSKL